jgi:hypothetical protein
VFTFFGLLEPAVSRYQSQIFRHVGNGVRISFPPVTPAAGLSSYVGELGGVGLVVVVVIAAGACTFDAHHGLATFLRTRVASIWQLVLPRFAVNAAAAAIAYLLGTLASAPVDLLHGTQQLSHYLPAFGVTVAVGAAALAIALLRLRTREI